MLEESLSNSGLRGRPLRLAERRLIEWMLADRDVNAEAQVRMPFVLVEDMQDGGMGSIRFLATGCIERHYAKTLAQARYLDEDGVVVSIVISVDQNGDLYEVDFWKVDFSPLKRYPEASEVMLVAVQ